MILSCVLIDQMVPFDRDARRARACGHTESRLKKWRSALRRKVVKDSQWERIARLLAGKPGDPGRPAADNRTFREAVLRIARTDAPRRDLFDPFGLWNSVFRRVTTRPKRWKAFFHLRASSPVSSHGYRSLLTVTCSICKRFYHGTIPCKHPGGAFYRHADRLGRLSRRSQGHSHAKDDGPAGSFRTDRLSRRQDRG